MVPKLQGMFPQGIAVPEGSRAQAQNWGEQGNITRNSTSWAPSLLPDPKAVAKFQNNGISQVNTLRQQPIEK